VKDVEKRASEIRPARASGLMMTGPIPNTSRSYFWNFLPFRLVRGPGTKRVRVNRESLHPKKTKPKGLKYNY